MKEIIQIVIKGESGYGPAEAAYKDKVTITGESIRYEYRPLYESEQNRTQKWSYKTTSPVYQGFFQNLKLLMPDIMNRDIEAFVIDIGSITFRVTYEDKTRDERMFMLPGDTFEEAFRLVKQMVPGCENVPEVIRTSDDFLEEDEL